MNSDSDTAKSATMIDGIPRNQTETIRVCSASGAFFNIFCAIAGSGVLGLPYSLNQCGWIGVLFIILAAGMSIYTGRMLIECLYIDVKTGEPNGDLHEVGERSFGRPGKWFIQAVHYAVTLGCTTLYILLMGINIFSILKSYDIHFSQSYIIAICGVAVALPYMAVKDMGEVAWISALGAITTIIVVIIITVQGIVDTSQPIPATHKIIDYSGIPIALASICFSFGGAVVFPYVECTMKEPRKFPLVLTLAMTSIGALYLMISVVGYWKYGEDLKSPIFDNLQDNAPTLAARILITAHVYLACPVYLCTFGSNVERNLKLNRISNKLVAFSLRALFRGLTVAALTIIAIFLPHFNSIMSLIGSVCDCSLLFIIPILCHLKLKGIRGRPWYDYIMIAVMSVAAVVCLIWGTIDAIEGLIKDFKN